MKQNQKLPQKQHHDTYLEDIKTSGVETDSDIDDILDEIDAVLKDQPVELAIDFKQRNGE